MELVLLLIGINVVVFILPFIIPFSGRADDSFYNFLMMGWKSNVHIRDGEFYRLLTANFLHADFFHLLFNMFSLYNVGPSVVTIFRPAGFLIIYLLSGIFGSLASFFFNANPSVGASGAIFGLVGALLAYSILFRDFALFSNILLVIVINFIYALDPTHRIDNFGHLGGLVTGFALGFIFITFNAFI